MAFDAAFVPAMGLLILGAGLFRGNLSPQLGELYPRADSRRDMAFQLYGAAVNLGAFIAPLATGALGQAFGWHIGFAFAGFGMLLGLVLYLAGGRWVGLTASGPAPGTTRAPRAVHPPLKAGDGRIIAHLLAMIPISALFWIAQSQVWNTYNLWVRDHVNLKFGGWTMPIPWLQSLDGLSPFLLLPPLLAFWRWRARRGVAVDEPRRIAIGCFIFSAATLWLAGAGLADGVGDRAPLWWAVVFHLTSNAGWLFFAPTMNALYSRLAPPAVNATLMGCNTLSVFLGTLISGRLGGLYESLSAGEFWALHAALVGLGGVAMLVIGARLRREFAAT
jgi:POT family proton-dependent oligopeptide transporter